MTETLDVKIVQLPAMRVACVNGFGEEPEGIAFAKMREYMQAHGMRSDDGSARLFGYNNPNPTPGSSNYGYDVWVTVGPEIQSEGEVKVFDFPGGLYAVLRIKPVTGEEIFENWQKLVAWREQSQYRGASHQWLEEHIGDVALEFPDLVMDLYMPIRA